MKRINTKSMLGSNPDPGSPQRQRCTPLELVKIAYGINEIMDYLEHMTSNNGKIFTCVNCHKATGYVGDLGKCCDSPLYEVSD